MDQYTLDNHHYTKTTSNYYSDIYTIKQSQYDSYDCVCMNDYWSDFVLSETAFVCLFHDSCSSFEKESDVFF